MESALKQTTATAPPAPRRQRSVVPIPIAISGVDSEGHSFKEDSHTLVITRNGMMIETIYRLNLGTEVAVENSALGRSSTGRVVWCGGEHATSHVHEVGIYLPDAEYLCGIELSPEPTQDPTTRPDNTEIAAPGEVVPEEGTATHVPASESISPFSAWPSGAVDQMPDPAQTVAHAVEAGPTSEFDLTAEVGRIGTDSARLQAPGFPVLPEPVAPGGGLSCAMQSALESGSSTEAVTPVDPRLIADQSQAAAEGALGRVERPIHEATPVRGTLFEEQLEGLAQQALDGFQSGLQALASASEANLAAVLGQEVASVGERLQGARIEAESALTRLTELQQQAKRALQETVAQFEDESRSRLEQQMRVALEEHVVGAVDRLRSARSEVENLLARLADAHQAVERERQQPANQLEERLAALVETQVATASERLQGSRIEAESVVAKLEEVQERAQASLRESVGQLEERMAASTGQHLAAADERLRSSRAEAEVMFARLEEGRRQVDTGLEELADRLGERMTASVERHAVSVAERLAGVRAEADALLLKVEDLQQACPSEIEKVRTAMKELSGEAVELALAGLNEKLEAESSSAVARLGSCADEVVARVTASVESLRAQGDQISAAAVEKLRGDANGVLSDALEQGKQTARSFQDTTVEAAQENARRSTRGLVETTAAELRRLAQENLNLVSEQLAERQQQFTSDMSRALGHMFEELVATSSAKLRQITDNGLERIAQELAERQKLLINDTTRTFRQKISEILLSLQNGSTDPS